MRTKSIFFLILLLSSNLSLLMIVPVAEGAGEDWLTGWTYRKSHNVTGSSEGAQTEYPIKINIYRGSGTDSGENVYVENKSRADLGDIRFTASDGITPLIFGEDVKNGTLTEDKQDISINATRYQAFQSLVTCPNGDLLLAYRDGLLHQGNDGRTITRRSTDDGVTWGSEVEVYNNLTYDCRDPQLHVAPNGSMILFIPISNIISPGVGSHLGMKYAFSYDNGVTFGDWSDFPNDGTNRSAAFSAHLINLGSTIYGVVNVLSNNGDFETGSWGATLYKSTDNGVSWEKVSVIDSTANDKTCETTLAWIENDERFLTISRDIDSVQTFKRISTNAEGTTWGERVDVTSQLEVLKDPELTWFGDDLLILCGEHRPVSQTVYYESYDDGATFVNKSLLDDYNDGSDGGYTSTIILNSTTAYVTFYTDAINALSDIRRTLVKKKPNIFWVEVDAIPENPANATIYLYYGNSEATSTSTEMRENFTDGYVEVDPNNHIEFNETRITCAGLNRNEEAYVYKDLGAGYSGDHTLFFNFVRTSGAGGYMLHAGFGDEIDDASQGNLTQFLSGVSGADLIIYMQVKTGGVGDTLTWNDGSLGTVYYGVIQKYGTNTFLGIYSDAGRTNVLASATKTDVNTHRYIYGVSSLYTDSDIPAAGYNENFILRSYVDPEPLNGDWGAEETEGAPGGNTAPTRGAYILDMFDAPEVYSDGERDNRFWFDAYDVDGYATIDTVEFAIRIGSTWCNFSYDTNADGSGSWTETTTQTFVDMFCDGWGGSGDRYMMYGWMAVYPGAYDTYNVAVHQRINDTSSASSGWGQIYGTLFHIVEPSEPSSGGPGPPPDGDDGDPIDEPGDPYWWADPDNLDEMSTDDLIVLADALDVTITDSYTRDDIIQAILDQDEDFIPFEGCGLTDEDKLALLDYLLNMSIPELRQECQDLGIAYKLWRDPEPYIILIFTVGYGCSPPDAFYDQGFFDPEDWDDDGVVNWEDPDMFDETRMGLGARMEAIDISPSIPWIQKNGYYVIILALFLAFMYSQVKKQDKPGSRGESLLRPPGEGYLPGERR